MMRYVEAEYTKDLIDTFPKWMVFNKKRAMRIIDNAPSIEVPKPGYWKPYCTGYKGKEVTSISYRCTQCGRSIVWVNSSMGCHETPEEFLEEYPYCHCGAKMEAYNE